MSDDEPGTARRSELRATPRALRTPGTIEPIPTPPRTPTLTPDATTSRQWRDRRRSRRLALAARLCAPLAIVTILKAAAPGRHTNLAHRVISSVLPAVLIAAVALPLGTLFAGVAVACIRRRDRLRALAPGALYAGWAVLQAEPRSDAAGVRYLVSGWSPGWRGGSKWAVGELRLVEVNKHDGDKHDGDKHGGYGVFWKPGAGAKSRGFQQFWIPPDEISHTELEMDRRLYGYVRMGIVRNGDVDFGIMDMPRFADAINQGRRFPPPPPSGR